MAVPSFFAADKSGQVALSAVGSVEVAFTPGDNAAGMIVGAIDQAKKQVLVQAFSFTHEGTNIIKAHENTNTDPTWA